MNSTAIECKLIREGGTRVEIENTEYHFAPYTDGAHVCEVANEEHADRFLSIREGYRLYRGEGKPVAIAPNKLADVADIVPNFIAAAGPTASGPVTEPAAPITLNICDGIFDPEYTIHGATYALLAIAQRAQMEAGLTTGAWNALVDIERSDAIEAELNRIDAAGPVQESAPPVVEDRASLAAEYERLYGKKPHHNTGIDRLRELIAAKQ